MEHATEVGSHIVFYLAALVGSLFLFPYLGLKGPRPSLLVASIMVLLYSISARPQAPELRFVLRLLTGVAGAGVTCGILALFLRKGDVYESDADARKTVACPNCGRLNSVRTPVCPRCEQRL